MHIFYLTVIYYHLLVIMLILELLNIWLKKYQIYQFTFTSGILGIIITCMLLGYGYYNINQIKETNYQISSDKLDDFRIIEIADLHMSTAIDLEELRQYCQEMSQLNASIIVLTGDIFDENTPLNDVVEASKLLGKINNQLGIYYVYGNHDNGNYGKLRPEDIKTNLEANNIVVLDDQVICLDQVNIIGRSEPGFHGDKPWLATKELIKMIPGDKQDNYTILLDHQPLDLDTNANLGIDLQLSGHTHGGQLFPMGLIQKLTTDTLFAGKREIGKFMAITSSGISGWRYPLKTGAKSEYVVVEIN